MPTTREKVRRAWLAGAPLAIAARAYQVPPGTARLWKHRYRWQRPPPPLLPAANTLSPTVMPSITPAPPLPPPLWCRSLHHDWAHLIKPDGTAECDPKVRVPLGGMWVPVPRDELHCIRKCKRCMHRDQPLPATTAP